MKKYLSISRGTEDQPLEGFYNKEEALTLIRERLLEDPSNSFGEAIRISDEKPTTNRDLLENPSLVREDQNSFSILTLNRKQFYISNLVQTEKYYEKSQLVEFDLERILHVVSSIYDESNGWRDMFSMERRQVNSNHEAHAKILRAIEQDRKEYIDNGSTIIPKWTGWFVASLIIIYIIVRILLK